MLLIDILNIFELNITVASNKMRKNIFSALVILFISIVFFLVYSDINSNNDVVNQEVIETISENPELATNEIED